MATEKLNAMHAGVQSGGAKRVLTNLSDDERLFRETVRRFARDEVAPLVRRMDEEQQVDAGLLRKLFGLGLMGIEIPEELSGSGGTFFDAVLAVEEISAVDPAVGLVVDVHNTLVARALMRWATAEQKRRWLPRLATDIVGAYALSEAGAGSDAFALETRAERHGDRYVLNGRKLWISNAKEAGIFIVFATVDPAGGYKGITAFVIEKGAVGFSVGRKEDKLGIRASSTCELILDDCAVAADQVLGEAGKGYRIAIETLNEGRIGIGAQMLGLAEGALAAAVRHANERKQFGRPLADFQAMRFQLAEMATEIEAARLLVYNAARMRDAGMDFRKEAAMCKLFASRAAERVASRGVEVFGGSGFVKESPVEKLYRDAKIGSIYEGTSFMQLATIAKMILGGSN
ncbi:MAG TPA: acyl-CoA dehydrogenase family protein [Terracidiphilus sp.]|nr:acyl-CoA dehydrogenase family protein [Terracidiphilus sp.]